MELLQVFQYLLIEIYMMRMEELALEIASSSLRMEKCLWETHTLTCTYSVLVIIHPWFNTRREHPERAGAP